MIKYTIGNVRYYQNNLVHVISINEFWNEALIYYVSPVGKQQTGSFVVGLPRLQKTKKSLGKIVTE